MSDTWSLGVDKNITNKYLRQHFTAKHIFIGLYPNPLSLLKEITLASGLVCQNKLVLHTTMWVLLNAKVQDD